MTSHDEPGHRRELRLPGHKSTAARYLFALAATAVGLVATLLIFATDVSNQPVYAPLIGAVVLASLYGGFGPAVTAIALSWGVALVLLVGSLTADSEDVTRWWINLVVALLLATFGALLRTRTERTADVAVSARSAVREIESLHQLSIALSGSLSSSDVAEAVTAHAPEIVGARGAVLGLVEGDNLVIVDPAALGPHSVATMEKLPLDRATLLTRAAREASLAVAADRATLEEKYPDSAGLLRGEVQGGLALPVHAEGKVIGAIGFLFDRESAATDDLQTLTGIVADIVGQALERARLYERERESRRGLDRILRVAPRFLADDPDDVLTAICREARRTFGGDYGVLWRVGVDRLELLAIDPPRAELMEATHLPLEDFPRLTEAIRGLETSFVSDILDTSYGEGREFVRSLGIRSSLRTPVVISGRSELVLAVSWQVVVSEPDPATIAVVRRFADQAGLALEQLERRRAEADAAQRADRAELLQGMTALLSNALTPADVARVVVEQVSAAVGATAAVLAGVSEGQVSGPLYAREEGEVSDSAIAAFLGFDSEGDTPVGRAVHGRESVYVECEDDLGVEFPSVREALAQSGQRSVLFVPLVAGRRTNGLLVVSWEQERRLTTDERILVAALAGQAALALDRASHFESEQAIAETLQRSVLPVSLPRVEGVELAARYLPGSAQLDVGGDWFDALELPDGKLGLVVGDVVGKGVQAAASMAQLRNAIRAFSIERLRPSSVLTRLNRLAEDALDTSFATVGYIVLDPETNVCRLSCAGHPPPVVAYPDGRVELLEGARGLPLGTGSDVKYRQETIALPAGSVLVLYTDGLVERRGHSIDEGLADLRAAVADGPRNPDQLLEHVLERVVGTSERGDDIALLAARVLPVAPQVLDLEVPSTVDSMDLVRDAMRAWIGAASFQRSQTEDLVLATWEACANAIEHAADPRSDHIKVHAELDDSVVRVVVEDTGKWVRTDPREDRGLGLRLIRALMSDVEISEGGEGTRIAFEKKLARGPASVTEATRAAG